ncbi:hypothetical protein [Planktothrix paucivesiculata]|uniref:Uncharacterized protein n=1 Tax=Planktothrix paucivesiculata PCC 9631 TaxID=671071 RepID=A0A7Z9BQD8_9CYAN|nr:hypothetical protein [Planktothrix paucivesiculata]VXD20193.1 conserved hypothetical protein [Planktothrix paucivesiculata PCC 9631]
MKLRSNQINHQIKTSFINPMTDDFKDLLNQIQQEHYPELYESETNSTVPLSDVLNQVLEGFKVGNSTICHLRYLWMTLILTMAVEPTLEYYYPNDSLTKDIITSLELFIINSDNINTIDKKYKNNLINDWYNKVIEHYESLPYPEVVSFQVIYEAIDVFQNAIRVFDYDQAKEALLEILEDCLEGYAIFPGSEGRRDLFDWWLLEVVPASWNLSPLKSFYGVDRLINQDQMTRENRGKDFLF